MPALILTIMYIMNHICELGLCLNSNKPPHLYKSLTMWSFGGLIIRYQRFQFRLHIRRHQLGNVSRFHVAHFCQVWLQTSTDQFNDILNSQWQQPSCIIQEFKNGMSGWMD
jgi:hypothetical protein